MSMTDFTIISRSLTTRMFSTVTTAVTVAVAVALMMMLLSMRHAGERAFERGAGNMHMLVSAEDSSMIAVLNSVFYAGAPRQSLPWAKYQQLTRESGIPWAYAVPVQQGDSYRGFPVMATTPAFFTEFEPNRDEPWQLAEGRFFESPFEVVVGSDAALALGLSVGEEEIFLTHGYGGSRQRAITSGGDDQGGGMQPHVHYDFSYRVVGILERTGSAHDRALFTDLTSSWIIHAHDRRREGNPSVTQTTAEHLIDADRQITGIYLRVGTRPGRELSGAQQQVYNTLRADPSITVADPHQEIIKLFTIVSNIDQVFLGMAALVMISSGIAIMLALYNSMEQRRRQIAILRVLGCSRWRVFGLVLTESATIGLIGAIIGIVLSFLGVQVVAQVMHQRLGLVIDATLEPVWTFVLVMATILLAAVAGLAPAAVAYKTAVVRNLRPLG